MRFASDNKLTSPARSLQPHPWVNAALESQVSAVIDLFAVRSSGCNEIIGLENGAFWSHVWNVGELVEHRDDAASEIRNLSEV